MNIGAYQCSHCGFSVASDLCGGMFAIDDQGRRVACVHPGEDWTAADVLGIPLADFRRALVRSSRSEGVATEDLTERERAIDRLVATRLVFTVGCCCFACLARFERDSAVLDQPCPHCGSGEVHAPRSAIGRPCPRCEEAPIEWQDSGIHI